MNWDLYFAFFSASFALALMPGPDNIYVLTESLSRGAKRGVSLSSGLASGLIIHTSLAATGLALLLKQFPEITLGIRVAGTAYLLYIAFGTWKEKMTPLHLKDGGAEQEGPGFLKSWAKGFLMNVLNPKVTLFFLALLPQFVDAEARWSEFNQMFLMGFTMMLQAFLLFSSIALLAGSLHPYLAREGFWQFTRWFQIIVLFLIAFGLWFL